MSLHNSSNNPKVNFQLKASIEALLTDRPIAYHTVLAKALGSASAGILLSQLLYWTPRSRDEDRWIWKTREEIYDETALTRYEQESARKALRDSGVIKVRLAGMPARKYFKVEMERLTEVLAEHYEKDRSNSRNQTPNLPGGNQPAGGRDSHQHECLKPANRYYIYRDYTKDYFKDYNNKGKCC